MLVISPTRELAAQIAEEAKQITAFQQNFRVQVRLCVPHCSPKSAHCMMQARVSLCAIEGCLSVGMVSMSAGCPFKLFQCHLSADPLVAPFPLSQGAAYSMAGAWCADLMQ